MKNTIGLYFQLETNEGKQAFTMIRESLKKIEQLEDAGISVKYLELRAKELPGSDPDKKIWLKIDSDKMTYIGSDCAFEWEQAFIETFKDVEERILYEEADYTRNAALVELN